MTFAFPEVLKVIELCSINEIAVLGIEIFLVKNDGYHASGCSDYDGAIMYRWRDVRANDWHEYVKENNKLAEECIRRNAAGDEHVYILTTASWNEFAKLRKTRKTDDAQNDG